VVARDEVGPFSALNCPLLGTPVNVLGATHKRAASSNRRAERECSAVGSGVYGLSAWHAIAEAAALLSKRSEVRISLGAPFNVSFAPRFVERLRTPP